MMRCFLCFTAALFLALTAAGCSSSPRVTFYTLEPSAAEPGTGSAERGACPPPAVCPPPAAGESAAANRTAPRANAVGANANGEGLNANGEGLNADGAGPAIAVGPITLPEMVDRPQLVVRVAANRVEILEAQRWAEPLKDEIPRLVARNLGRLLGSNRVSSYRQFAGAAPDYRVLLDIVRFDCLPGREVTVEAAWSLRRHAGGAARHGRSLLREQVQGEGYEPLVAALQRALVGLSGDLARAVQEEAAAAK